MYAFRGSQPWGQLTKTGQSKEIYEELYRSAWEHYEKNETRRDNSRQAETAHRLAWAAVEQLYQKDEATGHWFKNQ